MKNGFPSFKRTLQLINLLITDHVHKDREYNIVTLPFNNNFFRGLTMIELFSQELPP